MPDKKIVIDLGNRFKNAFGFVGTRQSNKLEQSGFIDNTGIAAIDVMVRNNVTFEDFTIRGNGFDLEFGYVDFSKKGNPGKIFAPPPMISFSKEKNIERTEIDGSDAEVVERYGDRSWEITMQGLLIDLENHNYPSAKVRQTRLMFETEAPFGVSGQIWDDLGIDTIYFEKFEIAGVQGYEDTMQYTLNARSTKYVEAIIKSRYE